MNCNNSNGNDNNDDSSPRKPGKALTYTDAYELVSKKILINRLSVENLKHQVNYCQLFRKIQNITESIAQSKIRLVERLNVLFEQQLKEFSADRQEQCLEIYAEINKLDTPSLEFVNACNQIETLRRQMEDLISRIQHIESTIPNETVVTNYTVNQNKST
jgi:hypothetical protein